LPELDLPIEILVTESNYSSEKEKSYLKYGSGPIISGTHVPQHVQAQQNLLN
jgi:hypothetical protein